MGKTEIWQKLFISAILLVLFMIAPAMAETIPAYTGVYVQTANDNGILYDYTGNGTYYILSNGGGLNAIHITADPAVPGGQVTVSENMSGTFYLTDTGGRGYQDDMVLLLAINGTISDDFSVRIKASGYTWAPEVTADTAPAIGVPQHTETLDETFTKSDLIYGPQSWKPQGSDAIYPLFYGEDTSDSVNDFYLAFIDTRAGVLGSGYSGSPDLTDQGMVKVEYEFTNLNGYAAFNVYGWNNATSKGQGMGWTNMVSGDGSSGYSVVGTPPVEAPVASFEAGSIWGEAPLNVQFTDLSTNTPTSWSWDFNGDGVADSTDQNPSYTYNTVGTYNVSLTATNSAGSDTTTMTDYIAVGVAGGSLLTNSAWPEFGYDSQNTGRSPYNGPQTYSEKWITTLTDMRYSSCAIDLDGIIYAGSTKGYLYAVYPNGTIKWTYTATGAVECTPAISSDGTIYFGSGFDLIALNPDGTEKWISEGNGFKSSSPAIGSDGTIYTGYSNSPQFSINAVYPNGTLKWSYSVGGYICYNGIAIGSDGTIYVNCDDGNLYAMNPDGTVKWTYLTVTNYKLRTTPVVGSDGTIYIECYDGYVYAINSDGSLKWKYKGSSNYFLYTAPAIGSDGTIYITEYKGGNLHALNPDGTLKWTFTTENTYMKGGPAIGSDGTIYFTSYTSSSSGNIYAVNPDGSLKWIQSVAKSFWAQPSIDTDGTLYIGSYSSGSLYAIENVVDFTTDKTSGGSPLIVQFTGTSTRTASSWSWDFGDGATSDVQSPSHTYTSDGSYNVTLTITEEGTGETFTVNKPGYINAYTEPVAAFSADATLGQVPMTVNFTDESTNGPTEWLWDFGDGNTSSEQNPEYIYLNPGTYTVTLTAKNPAGSSKEIKNNYITIDAQPVPVVEFNASVTEGQAPLEVAFTDLSTGSPISWSWDFGNGATSAEQNPSLTYTVPGIYTVELSAENYGGSNNTVKTEYINVTPQDPPVAVFDATNITVAGDSATNSVPVPLTIQFTQNATGYNITSYLWDFGDGFNSTEENPIHTYESAGDYTINLTVINDGGTDTKLINLTAVGAVIPVVDFSVDKTYGKNPLTVQFTDKSLYDPTSWSWNFGDGETSTEQNPVHTYTNIGTYNITFTATNSAGSNTTVKADYITSSTTNAQPLPAGQCFNMYVANDEGVKYNVENGIVNEQRYAPYVFINNTYYFLYDGKGGGTNALHVSNDPSVSSGQVTQTINQSGEFWLTFSGGQPYLYDGLLLLAVNGTIPDDFSVHIRSSGYEFEEIPAPAISNVVSGLNTKYVDEAINQTFTRDDFIYGPQIWRPHRVSNYPIFVGQDMSDTSNTFELMFIDLRVGCTQFESDGYIKVEYEFNNLTSFAVFNGYAWYSACNHGTGVIMTTTGTEYEVIGIPDAPDAGFTSDGTGYILDPVQFTDTSVNVPQSWSWDFGDGTNSTEQNPEHTYTIAGEYTVTLTVTNNKGSNSISNEIIQIAKETPVVEFSADLTSGVSPIQVTFTDESINSPVEWLWDFGDGTTSTEQNPVHWYAPGTYSVNLTATNSAGSNTLVKTEYLFISSNGESGRIINPGFETGLTGWQKGNNARISSKAALNGGNGIWILPYSSAIYSKNYIAQYIDMTDVSSLSFWGKHTKTCEQYFRIYIDGTEVSAVACADSWVEYTIPLENYTGVHELRVAIDKSSSYGYLDDFSLVAETKAPVPNFIATSSTSGEYPLAVQFTDASSNYPTEWAWDFNGDGVVDSTEQNPLYTFGNVGTYTVSLTSSNEKGTDKMVREDYVTVKGAQKKSSGVAIKNNGTITDNGDGTVNYSVDQSQAQVRGNDVVIDSGSYTLTYKSDTPPTVAGGNIVSTVTEIELETDPVETILDEVGNVSGTIDLALNDLPADSSLQITLTKGDSGSGTDFRLAAGTDGLNVDNVAYTMNVVKTNLTNGQEIKEAKITMSVPVEWVNANGGTDAIKIIRVAEDGTKEVLDTVCIGKLNGVMTFEGYSPNGLSLFGLAAVSTQDAKPSSGSVSSSGGGKSDQGIDSAEKVKAGETATLTFDKTSIYEIDFYAKSDIPELLVTIESGAKPGDVSPEGDVYAYLYAEVYKAPEGSIEKDTIRFTVPSAWVNQRVSSPDLLSLWLYDESAGDWNKLSTVFEKEENGLCYCFADSADLGYLAIAAQPDLKAVAPTPLPEQTAPIESESTPAPSQPTSTPKATPLFGGLLFPVIVGILGVLAYANRRLRKD